MSEPNTQKKSYVKKKPQKKNDNQNLDKAQMLKKIEAEEAKLEEFSSQFLENIRDLRVKINEASKEAKSISKTADDYVKTSKDPLKSVLSASERRAIDSRYVSRVDGIFDDHTKYLEALSTKCKANEIPKNVQAMVKKINDYKTTCRAGNYENLNLEDLDKSIVKTIDELRVGIKNYKYQLKTLKAKYTNRLENAQSEYHSDIRKAVASKKIKGAILGLFGKSMTAKDPKKQEPKKENQSPQNAELKAVEAEHKEIIHKNASTNNFILELKNPASEQEFNDLMAEFSQAHDDYYSEGKGLDSSASTPHLKKEIKAKKDINKQMKNIINKRAEHITITERGFMDTSAVNRIMNPIPNLDVNSIAANEVAFRKLFELQSNGYYEKNGVKTQLTSKQRTAIAGILLKASEKRLGDEQYKRELMTKAPRAMQVEYQQEQVASMSQGG